MEYTFPFHTCEKPQKGIAQPYSALFNLINCIIIFFFVKNNPPTYISIVAFDPML
jgi:hypothetical protein